MPKLEGAALGVLGRIVATTSVVSLASAGCATGVNPAALGADDGEAQDQATWGDVGNGMATSGGGAHSDASQTGTNSGASSDRDAGGTGDALDATTAIDVATGMDADAGRADGDAGRRPRDAGGASDADAGTTCDTAAILFADAGVTGATLLFAFDNGAVSGNWIGLWDSDPTDAAPTPVVVGITDAGHACPGALQATFAFTTHAQQAEVQFNYRPPPAYPAGRIVHMWAKLAIVGDVDGGGYQAFSDLMAPVPQWTTGGGSGWIGDFSGNHYPPNFADGDWHECTTTLGPTDAGSVMVDFQQLAANLQSQWTEAGPPPSTALLFIDDIWIE